MSAHRDDRGRFAQEPVPRWYALLKPYAESYARMGQEIEAHLTALDDDTLAEVVAATDMPTSTNCWWAIYGVREFVRDEAGAEQYRREVRP